jgi:hypothetical protein
MVDNLKRLVQRSILAAAARSFGSATASFCLTLKHLWALFSQFPVSTEEVSSAFAASEVDALPTFFNDTVPSGLIFWATKHA